MYSVPVMLKVGLTGGIGAGKSEVSRLLVSYGAVLVDADKIAREVVEPGTPGLAAVVAELRRGDPRPDGTLDRPKLGSHRLRRPRTARRAERDRASAGRRPLRGAGGPPAPDAVVVHDVPLLAENGLAPLYDLVLVVDASPETQLDRLVRLRGMTEGEAAARAWQRRRHGEQRLAVADIVINNDGPLEELRTRVREVWDALRERAAGAGS